MDHLPKIGGYKITGPNGNNIFLPAVGIKNGQNIENRGSIAYYWTGSVALIGGGFVKFKRGRAFLLKDSVRVMPNNVALPIRPVIPKEEKQKQEEQQRKKKERALKNEFPNLHLLQQIDLIQRFVTIVT